MNEYFQQMDALTAEETVKEFLGSPTQAKPDEMPKEDTTTLDYAEKALGEYQSQKTMVDAYLGDSTQEGTPDRSADIFVLSKETGQTPAYIADNYDTVKQMQRRARLTTLREMNPTIGDWLVRNPTLAGVAEQDTIALSGLGLIFHRFLDYPRAGLAGFHESLVTPWYIGAELGSALLPEYVGGGARRTFHQLRLSAQANTAYIRGEQEGTTWLEKQTLSGVESTGFMIPAITAGLLAGPNAALYIMGAQTGLLSAASGLDEGMSPWASLGYGARDGAIEMVTEEIPAFRFLRAVKLKQSVLSILKQTMPSELIGESAATIFQNLNAWAFLPSNSEKTLRDYADEQPSALAATVVSTLTAVTIMSGGGGVLNNAVNAKTHAQQKDFFLALGDVSENSELRSKLPDEYKALVDKLTKDGTVENVYIAQKAWDQYWEQAGADPKEMYMEVMGNAVGYGDAEGDLVIPTSTYATKLAPTEHNAPLAEYLRSAKDAPASNEAMGELKKKMDKLKEYFEKEDAGLADIENVGQLVQGVTEQLVATGMPREEAYLRANVLYGSHMAGMIERAGFKPAEIMEKFNLSISTEGVTKDADGVSYNQEGKIITDTPEFRAFIEGSAVQQQLHHGTSVAKDFGVFSETKDIGFHLGTTAQANQASRAYMVEQSRKEGRQVPLAPRVMPVYASIKNPLRMSDLEAWFPGDFVDHFLNAADPSQFKESSPEELVERMSYAADRDQEMSIVKAWIIENGYDGIVYENEHELGEGGVQEDSYIAFSPTQIKSVFNRGTFDTADPNIYHQADTQNLSPDGVAVELGIKYDGEWDLGAGVTGYSSTPQTGPAQGATFTVKDPSLKSVREAYSKKLEEFGGDPKTFFQEAAPLYSQLQRVVEGAKFPAKASGEVMLNILRKGAVKKEEIKWSFVEDFLKGRKKVTKQELLDYLQGNEITVEEKVLGKGVHVPLVWGKEGKYGVGADDETRDKSYEVIKEDDGTFTAAVNAQRIGNFDSMDLAKSAAEEVHKEESDDNDNTKFSNYPAIKGGEDYQERLFKLPDAKVDKSGYKVTSMDYGEGDTSYFAVTPNYRSHAYSTEAEARAALDSMSPVSEEATKPSIQYTEPHYQEPQVFAHTRHSTFHDSEGAKVLLLQEIQSEWAKEGRVKGFKGSKEVLQQLEKNYDKANAEYTAYFGALAKSGDSLPTKAERLELERLRDKKESLWDKLHEDDTRVPNAPLLKNWHEFVLKKMIQYAAENDFDKIAWATGQQTADLYDLSKEIDGIDYFRQKKKLYVHKSGEVVKAIQLGDESELSNVVGKEVAQRLIDKADKVEKEEGSEGAATLSGLDLKMGGEWAFNLYDRMIPQFLNKFGKQWGAKVESVELDKDSTRARSLAYFLEWAQEHGDTRVRPELSKAWSNGKSDPMVAKFMASTVKVAQQSITITPALRDAALGGEFPLFQAAEFDDNGNINLTQSQRTILEVMHTQISEGAAGKRHVVHKEESTSEGHVQDVPTGETLAVPSTFPSYFSGQGFGKDETLTAITKVLAGKKLGSRQRIIIDTLSSTYRDEIAYDMKAERSLRDLKPLLRKPKKKNLGSVSFKPSGEIDMSFLADANASTLFHETGHIYLKVMSDLANMEGASEDIKKDLDVILDWLGVEGSNLKERTQNIKRVHHEKWARGFELFYLEGKAPNAALRGAFARFREWLIGVYETLENFKSTYNVELSDEVRNVMSHMAISEKVPDARQKAIGKAVVDLVAEGKDIKDMTSAMIVKLMGSEDKKAIVLPESLAYIAGNKALSVTWTQAKKAARKAYKAGNTDATAKWKEKMLGVIEKANVKVAKIKTEKQKMAKRRKTLKVIKNYLGLSDVQMKGLTKHRNIHNMTDHEFKMFKDKLLIRAEQVQTTAIAKSRVMETIARKRLAKIDNYQKALGLPTVAKMSFTQLEEFADKLETFEDGDVFMTPKRIGSLNLTEDMPGVKTWRQARELLEELHGVKISDLMPHDTRSAFKWDSALVNHDPFMRNMVETVLENLASAGIKFHEVESEIHRLAKLSEKSRGFSVTRKIIPQDKMVMLYLETPEDTRAEVAATLTPEQLDLAHYMREYYAEALEYLVKVSSLERGREDYMVHIRRGILENMKEDGLSKAVMQVFKNYELDEMGFTILDQATQDILPLNKFFQFSMRRTGGLAPTTNVVKAFLIYARMFEKKKALDIILPTLDTYAMALTPQGKTKGGKLLDETLLNFVRKYLNNKKGRQDRVILKQGGKTDLFVNTVKAFVSVWYLGGNAAVQAASTVGEQLATNVMLGSKSHAKGEMRRHTKKGKAILKRYEEWVSRTIWEELSAPGVELGDKFMTGLFGLFHESSRVSNGQFLLASLTDNEYNSGEIRASRLAEMRLEMGRFRAVPGSKSLVGSTALGGAGIQFKSWAVVMLYSTYKDIQVLQSDIRKRKKGALTTREARELYRIASLSLAAFFIFGMGDDGKDNSWWGQLLRKARRESLGLIQALDPSLYLSSPPALQFLYRLFTNIKLTIVGQRNQRGERSGLKALEKQLTPAVVKQLQDKEKRR